MWRRGQWFVPHILVTNYKFRRNLGVQRDDVTMCRLSDGCEASVLAQVLLLARIYADALTVDDIAE